MEPAWRPSESAAHLLHRASQLADRLFVELVGVELTPRQFVILAVVSDFEGANQVTIVEKTGIDRSSVAMLVKRLVQRGLLKRRRVRTDVRSYAVRLTAKGEKIVRDLLPAARRVDEALLRGDEVIAALRRSLEHARRAAPDEDEQKPSSSARQRAGRRTKT